MWSFNTPSIGAQRWTAITIKSWGKRASISLCLWIFSSHLRLNNKRLLQSKIFNVHTHTHTGAVDTPVEAPLLFFYNVNDTDTLNWNSIRSEIGEEGFSGICMHVCLCVFVCMSWSLANARVCTLSVSRDSSPPPYSCILSLFICQAVSWLEKSYLNWRLLSMQVPFCITTSGIHGK